MWGPEAFELGRQGGTQNWLAGLPRSVSPRCRSREALFGGQKSTGRGVWPAPAVARLSASPHSILFTILHLPRSLSFLLRKTGVFQVLLRRALGKIL